VILHELGCPKLQGFLYSEPLDRDACGEYLMANAEQQPDDAIIPARSVATSQASCATGSA
jgi:hypothetical protein